MKINIPNQNITIEIGGTTYNLSLGLSPAKEAPVEKKGSYPIYGVKIDKHNKDPFYSVTYTHDAEGFVPASGGNENFNSGDLEDKFPFNAIKPCLLKEGRVLGYLNPNNYAEYDNGSPADITSGDANVMIEIPKVYYKITQDSDFIYVQISADKHSLNDGFTDWAFSYKGEIQNKFYVGAYKGYSRGGKLFSISGKEPTCSRTIGEFRRLAQANGEGYEITNYNKLVLLQVLYLIRFKSLDSQTALGRGNVDSWRISKTGETDTKGFNFGLTKGYTPVKCHGIEDFWGNVFEWVDGLISINGGEIKIVDSGFNDDAFGYAMVGKQAESESGFISQIKGDNNLGFLIDPGFCDYGCLRFAVSGRFPCFGGYAFSGSAAGAFRLGVYYSASDADDNVGARLLYCKG